MKISDPVVFLPGTLCDERLWMPCWQQLELSQRAYVPLQWAEDLAQMLAITADRVDSFTQKVHLLGFSMGGYVASLYALAHPHRIASLNLVGYNPAGLSEQELQQRRLTLEHIAKGQQVTMTPARLGHFVAAQNMHKQGVVSTIKEMESDLGSAVLAYQIKATTPRKDLSLLLAQSDFAVNFILAEEDKIALPERLRSIHQQHGSTQIIAGAGHMLPLEQPELLAKALYTCLRNS